MARKKSKSKSRPKPMTPADWENLPEDELLRLRVRDLGLKLNETPLAECVKRLYAELNAIGIDFHPPCYLADEWLAPDRVPVIGIPFYLAHPRLKHLEQKMMLEVEGATDAKCMKLLRHEAGHALNYAYELFKRTRWRELFGPFSAKYKQDYRTRPYSKRFVRHLRDHYAQSHPDEDWAETFAVWLTPNSNWSRRYRDWPVIRKLNYVNSLFKKLSSQPAPVTTRKMSWSASRMTSTLAAFYERRRRYLAEDFPGFYDPGLQRIFSATATDDSAQRASHFLRQHRRKLINSVAFCTGQRKYDIDKLLRKLIKRCDVLKLTVGDNHVEAAADIAAYVTTVIIDVRRFYKD